MTTAKIIISDETNCKIENLELPFRKKLANQFKYEIPGARFTPACKLGRWDGCKSFAQLGGSTYINLLPEIIPMLSDDGYSVVLEDLRDYETNFSFTAVTETSYSHKCWPKGHEREGQPITLRDYQVAAINLFLENPQSIQCLATGSGKCLESNTLLSITIDENSEFGTFLLNTLRQGVESDVTKVSRNNKLS